MKNLNLEQMEKVNGGASLARCGRMAGRHNRRGGGNTRLYKRMKKNCMQYYAQQKIERFFLTLTYKISTLKLRFYMFSK